MYSEFKAILSVEKIEYTGVISSGEMTVINPHLLPEADIKSCIVFLVPYRTDYEIHDSYGVSLYARALDYHIYFDRLYERIIPLFEDIYPGESFFGFADRSPINEKLAAANASLGVIGRNSLLVNEKYGSFVFIGTILTTLSLSSGKNEVRSCINCRECINACPTGAICEKGIIPEKCLSYISQKKHKNEEESMLLRNNGTVWGCDICQNACPMNKGKKLSDIEYFHTDRLDDISEELIDGMSEECFKKYPFSLRGKNTIQQNLENIRYKK